MPCTDQAHAPRRVLTWILTAAAALLTACGTRPPAAPPTTGAAPPAPSKPMPPAAAPGKPGVSPMRAARNWDEYRRQVAQRLIDANPTQTYTGPSPDPLLAIPVIEVELFGDGRIRRMAVLRVPRQAKDTMQLAMDAIKRAAPFGPVEHLPQPWKFVEVFLFDDERRFKPRTLEE